MKKYRILILFALALLLELSVFNYKWYLTLTNREYQPEYEVGEGLYELEENVYLVLEEGECTIRLTGLEEPVEALRLDIGYEPEPVEEFFMEELERKWQLIRESERKKIYVRLMAQDEANAGGFTLGWRDIVHEEPRTTYLLTHLSGSSDWIEYSLTVQPDEIVCIYALTVNPRVPFHFSVWRFLAVGGFLSLLYLLRPGSSAYRQLCTKSQMKELIVLFCVLGEILIFSRLVMLNPYFVNSVLSHHDQYYRLAEAFHEKQLHLTEEPPEFLKQMENPYDSALRDKMASEAGETALWDHAYYNGKYYVYFGVVPELLFYYPYYELMGETDGTGEFVGAKLEHYKIIFFCAAAMAAAVYLLLWELVQLWFRRTPFLLYLLLAAAFSMGNGVLTILTRPDFYSVPIICGLMFSLWGLYFWLLAKRKNCCPGYLFAGSLCMALVAGCRPQMLVMSFLALPLFWTEIRERSLLSGRSWLRTLMLGLPYLAVAAGLMYYNAARFGSPFDFGANYNLTTNDMTKRGLEIGRVGLGLFTYLFQPVNFEAAFPFIIRSSFHSSYLGRTIWEGTYGGALAANLILMPLLLLPWMKKLFRDSAAFRFSILSLVCGIVVVLADTQMAGILPRYYSDFSSMLYLAACPLLFALYEYCLDCGEKGERLPMMTLRCFLMAALAAGLCYHGLRIYTGDTSTLILGNPKAFYEAAHTIAFWR